MAFGRCCSLLVAAVLIGSGFSCVRVVAELATGGKESAPQTHPASHPHATPEPQIHPKMVHEDSPKDSVEVLGEGMVVIAG